MALASMVKGAPAHKLAAVASAMYAKAGFKSDGESFLRLTYQASENPEVRTHLEKKISEFRRTYSE